MEKKLKHVHFLGICGRGNAGVAKMMKDLGWKVTGSDQGAYPPMTTYLEANDIPYFSNYKAEHITPDINLVVVGGNTLHVDSENEEFEEAKRQGKVMKTWPELVQEYLVKPNSIVVTGTYGKTTVTALLTKIFQAAELDPSFMIGEASADFPDNVKNTEGEFSIIEGDEHPTHKGFIDTPKFHFYNPMYLLVTAALWDHFDIYTTEEAYVQIYRAIIKKLPTSGFLLLARQGKNNQLLAQEAPCPVFWYDPFNGKSDYRIENVEVNDQVTKFTVREPDVSYEVETKLFGEHNLENIFAAIAMSRLLGIGVEPIQKAMRAFTGLKKHLELLAKSGKITVYQDLGQHPGKARGAVEALKKKYADKKLLVVLDTHASVLHEVTSLQWYGAAYARADEVLVAPLRHRTKAEGGQRVTGSMIVQTIESGGGKAEYYPDIAALEADLLKKADENAVILFLSTGNFGGLIDRVISQLKNNV